MIQAGKLRHRITIERNTGTIADGSGNARPDWQALYSGVPAQITPLYNSHEMYAGQKTETLSQYQILIRYLPDITPKMRVAWDGKTLPITGTLNKDERNIELMLLCESSV